MELDLKSKAMALSAVKAIVTSDGKLLNQALNRWDSNAQDLLLIWAVEAITRKWSVFNESDLFGIEDMDVPLSILKNVTPLARPNLRARVLYSLSKVSKYG